MKKMRKATKKEEKMTYARGSIIVNIFRFLLRSNGHETFQDSSTQVLALDFGFFAEIKNE